MDEKELNISSKDSRSEVVTNKDFKTPRDESSVRERELQVVDEYFANGFNGKRAMLSVYPNMNDMTSAVTFGVIMKKDYIKDYVSDKRKRIRARASLEPEQVISELLNWAYADPTEFMALTPEEVKMLPPEVKRCIQTVNYRKTDSYDKNGNKTTREVMDLKFVDKTKAIDMLNKILGNYALDNKQKGSNINVENLNVQELKVLQQILNKE